MFKRSLEKIRRTIREAAPDAAEAIKYQMPTFVLKGNLVHFAAFKHHIGFYPAPTGIEEFKVELALYQGVKGSVRFPLDQPIPYDLIGRIVKFRVKENLERAESEGEEVGMTNSAYSASDWSVPHWRRAKRWQVFVKACADGAALPDLIEGAFSGIVTGTRLSTARSSAMNTVPAQEIKRRGIAAVDDLIAKGISTSSATTSRSTGSRRNDMRSCSKRRRKPSWLVSARSLEDLKAGRVKRGTAEDLIRGTNLED